ncbi:MAG TPA: DUF2244 domain-containing protein [Halioglobus sp.]
MVSSSRTATQLMIIARPNQSAAWSANVLLLLMLSIFVLTIAIAFALLGAWLILPFAGAELVALGVALYYVNWKQQNRHVITVSNDSVRIDKGHDRSRQHWQFPRQGTGLTITTEQHPWDRPELCVHDRNQCIELGEFLNREDSLKLIHLLEQEFRVRACSARATQEF